MVIIMKNILKSIFKNKKQISKIDMEQFLKNQADNKARILKEVKPDIDKKLEILLPLLCLEKDDVEKIIDTCI